MKKMKNATHIEGLLYQHSLEEKVTGENSKNPGTEYITGTIDIATDNDVVNIIPVHFTYVTEYTSKNKKNDTYTFLKNILNKVYKTCIDDGIDNATKIRVDSAIGLNEFWPDRDGEENFVSVKRNEGGFLHTVQTLDPDENKRNTFDVDMVITGVRHIDEDEEKSISEHAIVKGAIFGFKNDLLPVELSVTAPRAIAYFEGLDASGSQPVFTELRGVQISESIKKSVVEESAFGDSYVKEYTSTKKDFVITWAKAETYEWDSEDTLTARELADMVANREIYLAELKKKSDDYKASKDSAGSTSKSSTPAKGGFNF